MMNVDAALLAIAAAAAAAVGLGLADITALVVALGTLTAGLVHARRLRIDRPKVLEEVTSSVQRRLQEENRVAWDTVDTLRRHERELERRLDELENERRTLEKRVEQLERIVGCN